MRNARLEKHKLESRLPGEITITSDMQRRRQWRPTPVLLPGKSHGQRNLVGCSPWGRWVRHDWATSLSLFTFMHWRRKCNPLQCSCLENHRDGGAGWAAIYGVTQSQTRLKQLSSSSRYADDTTLMAESEELKSPLVKVKAESENIGLKLNIQKTKITASGSITSWQEKAEAVTGLIFLGSKITADGDCSHEIKDAYSLEGQLWQT